MTSGGENLQVVSVDGGTTRLVDLAGYRGFSLEGDAGGQLGVVWGGAYLVPPREKKMNMVVPMNSPSMAMKSGIVSVCLLCIARR